MARKGKSEAVDQARKILAALSTHFAPGDRFTLGGVAVKVELLQKRLQSQIDAWEQAQAMKTQWQVSVARSKKEAKSASALLPPLRAYLIQAHGGNSVLVADFGFTPKKAKIPVETKRQAVAKRAATRKARGTMGKKQKAKIKGAVPT